MVKKITDVNFKPERTIITPGENRMNAADGVSRKRGERRRFINRHARIFELHGTARKKNFRLPTMPVNGFQNIECAGRNRLMIIKQRRVPGR